MISHAVPERQVRSPERSRLAPAIAAPLGFGGLVVSAVAMIALQFVAIGQVDPVGSTMSNYVFVAGYGWLFPAAITGMAAGGFAVLLALARSVLGPSTLLRPTV